MTRPLVAFDEAGNTGQHLLDQDQPVFVLASVRLADEAAREVVGHATPPGATEVKFAKLRRSRPGQKRILELLDSEVISTEHVKVAVYHKPFMVTTKIVDMLVETLWHAHGLDLYAGRRNLALANLLHSVAGVYCGRNEFFELQRRFVAMVRGVTPETVEAFYEHLARMRQLNTEPEFDGELEMLLATRAVVDEAIKPKDAVALDPAIPAFFQLASEWTAALRAEFEIVHDRSKPLALEQRRLELLMTDAEPRRLLPGRGHAAALPISARGIRFEDSHAVPQLQLADVIASASAYAYGVAASPARDRFAMDVLRTRLGELTVCPVWPSRAVTPEELGEHDGASAAIDYISALAARESERRARA